MTLRLILLIASAADCSNSTPPQPLPADATGCVGEICPSLAMLAVSPLQLFPPFSPDTHDYYLRCSSGQNALTVSMAGSTNALTAMITPTRSPVMASQTLNIDASENEAIVVTATEKTVTSEYWIRCLPSAFPLLQTDPHPAEGTPTPGYYVIGNSGSVPGYAMLLNGDGVPVWYAENADAGVDDVDNVVNGAISYFSTWQMDPASVVQLNPLMTSSVAPSGTELDTHELRVLSSGNYLALSYVVISGVNLTGIPYLTMPAGGPNANMTDCKLVEFEPSSGKVVWSWTFSEHFDPVADSIVPQWGIQSGLNSADVWHCNSIDVDPANGNLLVSARNMDSVFYVEKTTGALLWKMGGSKESKDGAVYVPLSDAFHQQHDARLQPGWSEANGRGQISVFDDESEGSVAARALLLDVNVDMAGDNSKATVAWQYRAQGTSADRGSFRVYPDGSRVIGWGQNAAYGLVFSELDAKGVDLLDFYFADGDVSYRAVKIRTTAFDLGVLRRTAGVQ
jgi:hypothetical protein